MRFHIFAAIITITLVDGGPPVISEDAWIANNDTAPLNPSEYPMLKFRTTFYYAQHGLWGSQVVSQIAEKSPLQCYDVYTVNCGDEIWPTSDAERLSSFSKKPLAIITELK